MTDCLEKIIVRVWGELKHREARLNALGFSRFMEAGSGDRPIFFGCGRPNFPLTFSPVLIIRGASRNFPRGLGEIGRREAVVWEQTLQRIPL
jgi:hypothetical protein